MGVGVIEDTTGADEGLAFAPTFGLVASEATFAAIFGLHAGVRVGSGLELLLWPVCRPCRLRLAFLFVLGAARL